MSTNKSAEDYREIAPIICGDGSLHFYDANSGSRKSVFVLSRQAVVILYDLHSRESHFTVNAWLYFALYQREMGRSTKWNKREPVSKSHRASLARTQRRLIDKEFIEKKGNGGYRLTERGLDITAWLFTEWDGWNTYTAHFPMPEIFQFANHVETKFDRLANVTNGTQTLTALTSS